ncbi:MAG TPA: type II toxin-antitoxin system HigB family toxin [Pelolinea sp.]|nr:type II toxin-antitoxin system HigB family toxin [Pelolinea sp.]
MRIISRNTIKDFWENPDNRDAEGPLRAWFAEASQAAWKTPAEVKSKYGNGSIIHGNRFVFNIAGNKYRLAVKIHYNTGVIYIRFIGTHAQYDQINVETI